MGVIDLIGGAGLEPDRPMQEGSSLERVDSRRSGGEQRNDLPRRPDLSQRSDFAAIVVSHTPVGPLLVTATSQGLRALNFLSGADDLPREFSRTGARSTAARVHLKEAVATLRGYFSGLCTQWDLQVDMDGLTDFQRSVFRLLLAIPFGELRSYGELAAELGERDGARAVGRAVGSNPLPILIPCHRVVRNDGRLGGFSGGLERKMELLRLEGVDVEGSAPTSRIVPGGLRLDL